MCHATDSNSATASLAGGADAELSQLALGLLDQYGVMVYPRLSAQSVREWSNACKSLVRSNANDWSAQM